jgi:hypothetical protein
VVNLSLREVLAAAVDDGRLANGFLGVSLEMEMVG